MAQKTFFNWQDSIKSFEFGEQFNGIIQPGRYRGYDQITDAGGVGININLAHLITGHSKTIENNSQVNNVGIAMLPNGTVVHETTALPNIPIDTNGAGPNARVDLIIAEHEYTQVDPGTPVVYSVVKGDALGNVPSLPNPEKQIELGRLVIGAGGTTFGDILSYTPASLPLLGNESAQSFRDKLELLTQAEVVQAAVQRDLYKIQGDDSSGKHIEYDPAKETTKVLEDIQLEKEFSTSKGIQNTTAHTFLNFNAEGKNIWEITSGFPGNKNLRGIEPPVNANARVITIVNDIPSGSLLIVYNQDVSAIAGGSIRNPQGADLYLNSGDSIQLFYDTNSNEWVVIGVTTASAETSKSFALGSFDNSAISIAGSGSTSFANARVHAKVVGNMVHIYLYWAFTVDSAITGSIKLTVPHTTLGLNIEPEPSIPYRWAHFTVANDINNGRVCWLELLVGTNETIFHLVPTESSGFLTGTSWFGITLMYPLNR